MAESIYYIKIRKCVEDSILSYTYYEYMNSKIAQEKYVEFFSENLYDKDLHYIEETGQAGFNDRGYLVPLKMYK